MVTYVAASSAFGNSAALNITIPATAAVGDVAWLGIAAVDVNPGSAPGGWTLVTTTLAGNLATKRYRKTLVSGEPGSTITVTAPTANKMTVMCVVFRDVDDTTDPEGSETPADIGVNVSGATRTNPATTIPAERMLLSFVFGRGNTTLSSWTAPAGWTRVAQAFNTSSGETSGAVAYRTASAGAVGGDDRTSDIADLRGVTMLVVIEPIASSTPAPPSGLLHNGIEHTIWTIAGPLALAQAGAIA